MATPKTNLSALQLLSPVMPSGTSVISINSSVLPISVIGDSNTTRLEVSIYNGTTAVSNYVTTTNGNEFSTSVPVLSSVASATVSLIGRNYDPTSTWVGSTSYSTGYTHADNNGNVQLVVQAGTSGSSSPTWSTKPPSSATKVSIESNQVTVFCSNTFSPGQKVYLYGLINATFLNGVVLTVVTASSSYFTATLIHNNYTLTVDAGYIASVTVDSGVLWANTGAIAVTPTVNFTLLYSSLDLSAYIGPPTGIKSYSSQDSCELRWVTPSYPGFIGVKVMVSTDYSGVNPAYTQYGDLVSSVSSSNQTVINQNSTTKINVPTADITNIEITNNLLTVAAVNNFVVGTSVVLSDINNADFLNGKEVTLTYASDSSFEAMITHADYESTPDSGTATSIVSTNTVTSIQTSLTTDYSTVTVSSTDVDGTQFYVLFSTVVQDPTTNVVYESIQNGPLLGGFVNLQLVSPMDFPVLQRKEDIAGRLIAQIVRQRPDLDLSPRSEIRDVSVDPFSIEVSNMTVREWFARLSNSISAISQLDDSTGTGVSDSFASSPYKQQISRAYGLSSTDTQTLIDEQFDILGEQAGLTRLGSTTSTGVVIFYTYQLPQSTISIPVGSVVGSSGDSNTSSMTFTTMGQGVIDATNLSSYYNAQYGWWAVSVPVQCTTAGSAGNVGAGAIDQVVSGVPEGVNVTNLVACQYGGDQELNSNFAARIRARQITGVDTGTRNGYKVTALSTPGISDATVVAAGDLEMLRDWDPIRQKHVYGAVDIYTRGSIISEQDETAFFEYANTSIYGKISTYVPLTLSSKNGLQFQITNFSSLAYPLYNAVEIVVTRAGVSFYLGVDRAQFDNVSGTITLNANDMAYQYVGTNTTQAKVPLLVYNAPATNAVALGAISAAASSYTFSLFARYESPFKHTPELQPVLNVLSVTGQSGQTGPVSSTITSLVHTSDYLLNGGSNEAGDIVEVGLGSSPTQATITASATSPVLIDVAMDVPLDTNGNPTGITSVLSTDLSTSYIFGKDYTVVPMGPYHQYGLSILSSTFYITQAGISNNILTIVAKNELGVGAPVILNGLTAATFLNGQTVIVASATSTQFTAVYTYANYALANDTGTVSGSSIQDGQSLLVTYNKFQLYEHLTFVENETQVLNSNLPTTLNNTGFVYNTWLPNSYGNTTLALDGWNGAYTYDASGNPTGLDIVGSTGLVGAQIPWNRRYIKVAYTNGATTAVYTEGIDFVLSVDSVSGATTISRLLTGKIPNGVVVNISYFYLESFVFATQYPAFVEILANQLLTTKHAAADVIVKAMVESPVDITMTITLSSSASVAVVDPAIRTAITIALDNADGVLYQSELISQVQAITGVQNIQLPLIKCAKSDGSYDIGSVIPSGTNWTILGNDPAFSGTKVPSNSWITADAVLPDSTIPSGGLPNGIVNFMYQGQTFRRASSVNDFLTNSASPTTIASISTPGSFYIIGTNDTLNSDYERKILLTVPQDVSTPSDLAFFCTYQVFGEGGANDITVSSTEYLAPGTITLNYQTA